MSYKFNSISVFAFWCLCSCSGTKTTSGFEQEIAKGLFSNVEYAIDSAVTTNANDMNTAYLDSVKDILHRVRLDFSLNEAQVREQLAKYFADVDDTVIADWEESGMLEMRTIDGEKRYFRNAVANLRRLLAFEDAAKVGNQSACNAKNDELDAFCLEHTARIIDESGGYPRAVETQPMKISYRLTVKADAVPAGELVRCWLPAPREGSPRQVKFNLLNSDPSEMVLAPSDFLQRTFYLEKTAVAGKPTVFSVEYLIQTKGQFFDLKPEQVGSYDTNSGIYRYYTREQAPHLVFTPQIEYLGKRIVGKESNPLRKVEKIYRWINDSIPWASALEYSIIPNIPAYVLDNRHGDCGMQTLLFMCLARSQGIPVKWQSGFMLHPGNVNLHDWCEVYYEGIGWVPLDQSFKLQKTFDPKLRDFYVHGIDAYRLIVNDDFSQELLPAKKYLRSEPLDFQRGEVEWKGGNLYFDQWTWDIDVEYLTEESR